MAEPTDGVGRRGTSLQQIDFARDVPDIDVYGATVMFALVANFP
jgi:hypothetical protein